MKKDTGIRVKYGVPYFIVRVMAIGMLFLILNTSNILAATESPVVLDLSLNQTTLEQVFRELEKQSGYSIIYKSSEVNLKEVLSVDVSKEPLENVLNKVLRKQGLTYEIKDEGCKRCPRRTDDRCQRAGGRYPKRDGNRL